MTIKSELLVIQNWFDLSIDAQYSTYRVTFKDIHNNLMTGSAKLRLMM